jgi:uncharacterized membrane protein
MIKKYFISGLAFLLPIAITLAILNFVIEILTKPFHSLFFQLLNQIGISDNTILLQASRIFILMLLFVLTLVVGALVRWFITRKVIRLGEYIISHIPLINKVYKASQDVIHTLIASPTSSFKQVVMVPFPNENSFCLGLLVKEGPKECQTSSGQELLSVFVPTTPNPTTGFILMFTKEQVRFTDITVEDALKYIISCGMIIPTTSLAPLTNESIVNSSTNSLNL